MTNKHTSRISGFYKRSLAERAAFVAEWANLSADKHAALIGVNGLSAAQADNMIENAVGTYALPLGVATNFLINDKDYIVPMVVEEPSVVAAVSSAAKLFRESGGFITSSDEPVMIGQLQVLDLPDLYAAAGAVRKYKQELMQEANKVGGSIVKYGGGARDIEVRPMSGTSIGDMLIVHVMFDARDAMGANAVNTVAERLAPYIEKITGGRVNLRILSNLTDRRKARAEGKISSRDLATNGLNGVQVVKSIVEAGVFAEVDPYRAATHNKGIMNGVDAVVIATGNDWRAVEAGAHAYASREGRYSSLTRWWQGDDGDLYGSIELPLALGIVGGATRVHPTAQIALEILGVKSAQELSEVAAAVGLAQNMAAIRALATDGIQKGHMRLHAKQLAVAAGATGNMVDKIVEAMVSDGTIRLERAKQLVAEFNEA
ncbi:MAG: hydroxymethylglutaryl-CoA reductase, degradative [Chloroflexota bacterium]